MGLPGLIGTVSPTMIVVVKAGNAPKKDFWGYKCAVL